MSADAKRHADLPGVLAEIAAVAGRTAALDLAMALGGSDRYVAHDAAERPDHPLTRALGSEAAAAVVGRFGGSTIYIPHARRALARHLAAQGVATNEIARTLGCSAQAGRRYRAALRGNMFP